MDLQGVDWEAAEETCEKPAPDKECGGAVDPKGVEFFYLNPHLSGFCSHFFP